jgi:hypothetical protein
MSSRLNALIEEAKLGPLSTEALSRLLQLQDEAEQERIDLDRKSRELKKVEDAAEQLLIDQIRKNKVLNVQCPGLTVSLAGPKNKPHVQEWPKFYAFILEHEDFSLLERRPSAKAITERWDDNQVVPGVEKFPVYTLSKSRP